MTLRSKILIVILLFSCLLIIAASIGGLVLFYRETGNYLLYSNGRPVDIQIKVNGCVSTNTESATIEAGSQYRIPPFIKADMYLCRVQNLKTNQISTIYFLIVFKN